MATRDRRGVDVDSTDTAIAGSPNPGLAIKAPCLVATTGNIVLSGLQTIDGVVVTAGKRVLVWQQTDQKLNGLYNASTGPWTRTIDADSNDQFASGMLVEVSAGALYVRDIFQLTTPDPVTVGTSNIAFIQGNPVPSARRVNTTAPLAGGGDLGADLTLSIAPHGISYALMQQASAGTILGNPTGALANVSEISLGATLAFAATLLTTVAMTGDVTTSANSFATTIQPHVVSNSKFRQSAALSVVGNSSNATADVADIAAASDNQVLRRSGTAIGFGAVNLASTSAVTGVLVTTSMPALTGDVTTSSGAVATTIANNAVTYAKFQQVAASSLVANPTGSLANAQGITLGATLAFSGTALQTAALTGDISSSANSFVTAIGANKVTSGMLRQGVALSVIGVTGSATANEADIAGTANQVLRVNSGGTALAFGSINLASSAAVTGTLPSANGGTDNATYAIGDLLQASASTTLARLAAVATGNALISGGVTTVSSWGKIGLTTHISGTLAAGNGGTGATSLGVEFTVAANVLHVATNGITYALLQQVAASSLVGNATGGLANATGITLGATLAFSGSALQTVALTGDVTAAANSFATTVAKIAGTTVSGTTGSGNVVFGTAPTIAGGSITALTAFALRDTSAAFDLTIAATSTSAALSAGRTLTLDMGNVAHTLKFGTTANTITFPNVASDTVGMLGAAQTFSAVNTFSSATPSTTVSTGAVVISAGGLGVFGDINWTGSTWTNYTPSIDSTTNPGQITSKTINTARWKAYGKLITFTVDVTLNTVGTALDGLLVGLPVAAGGGNSVFAGREAAATGLMLQGYLNNSTTIQVRKTDNTTIIANGREIFISGFYEAA